MRWILGIDTRDRSAGAMHFVEWLREHIDDPEFEVRGFHVLEHDHMMVLLRRHHLKEVLSEADASMRKAMERAGAGPETLRHCKVTQGMTAEQFLAEAVDLHNASGVIIGRQARRESDAIARLGRVARRLVRKLPGSVVVVPPDLMASDLGRGPVVCAMAPSLDALEAAKTAAYMARRLGRQAVLIHAVQTPEPMLPDFTLDGTPIEVLRQAAEEQLTSFCDVHGLADLRREIVVGRADEVVIQRSAELEAPLLVVGSRQLALAERVFTSSLGTSLACYSRVPVMIVPPH